MDFYDLWKLGSPFDAVVEGLMMNMQNEGSIYTFRTCYGVTFMCGYARLMNLLSGPDKCSHVQTTNFTVYKLVKDKNVSISVTDSKYLIQDLTLRSLMGTSSQRDGLYSFHEENNDNGAPCEVCHKAKQTRKPFPLNDHKTISLRDLINLDVWGPYRVTSIEGFRYFLTVVDDYTRSVCNSEDSDNKSNNDMKECNRSISNSEDSDNKSQRPGVIPSDKATHDLDSSIIQQETATFDKGNMSEDEDFDLFGNIFEESAEPAKFVESKILKNERDSQADLPRKSSRKTTLPRKLRDYVFDKNVKYGIDKFVNYTHLNDIVVIRNNIKEIKQVKQFLSTKFLTKDLGKLKYFLEIEVLEYESGVCLTQRKYCLELLAEFGMLASKPWDTPIESVNMSIIMEYLVKISKKERILKLKRRNMKITNSDIQYAVSIKEDTTYLCLHFTKDHEGNKINMLYPGKTNTPHSSYRM
nr:ribonuclease H-like domain-containing protein [Tanacetum cinerariifolium]GEX75113.1 ribonuclease H-like domain-containing protein [Tanacetum cinerariifolium]